MVPVCVCKVCPDSCRQVNAGVCVCVLWVIVLCSGQMKSGSRWNSCVGPPVVTCRNSASISNADGSSVNPAAASCDLRDQSSHEEEDDEESPRSI